MNTLKKSKHWIIYDAVACLIAAAFCFYFIYPIYHAGFHEKFIKFYFIFIISYYLIAWHFKIYAREWRFASTQDIVNMVMTVSLAGLALIIIQYLVWRVLSLRFDFLFIVSAMLLLGGVRLSTRLLYDHNQKLHYANAQRTLIVGAGEAGHILAKRLSHYKDNKLVIVGYADDDEAKQGKYYQNFPVLGRIEDVPELVQTYKVEEIIIAMPSVGSENIRRITQICLDTEIETKIMPKIEDVLTGEIEVKNYRNIEIDDLLGRDPVKLDTNQICRQVTGKVILITGAGGSIGSEICRQLIRFAPRQLILVGHGENSIYQIHRQLKALPITTTEIIPIIADIKDREHLETLFHQYRPQILYHAAAHKHVPLMEVNPKEAIRNNIFGTKNLVEMADRFGVESFVMISTDKAVKPPNIMGATKRIAEEVVRSQNEISDTRFVAVRFGNVLGSRGSVVPLFQEQISQGGPVTVTDFRMTRYFMTIPEAARLVMQAGALKDDGEIYVLDMGEPIKILDLARDMIRLSGFDIGEIEIIQTGIRPGEKLYEEYITDKEHISRKAFDKIFVGKTPAVNTEMLKHYLETVLDLPEAEAKAWTIELANRR